MSELFELNPEKIEIALSIARQGKKFRLVHELRAPKEKEWIDYDRALNVVIEDVKQESEVGIIVRDNQARAQCDLWDKIRLLAHGYSAEPSDDCATVPPGHKQAAISCFLNVGPADVLEEGAEVAEYFAASNGTVVLSAIREDSFPRLVHKFQSPSKDQRLAFQHLHSENVIVRGNRGGGDKVVLPSRMKGILAIYDSLIVGVEGYAIAGRAPRDPEEVVLFMDAQHKVAAVRSYIGSEEIVVAKPGRACPRCQSVTTSFYNCETCGMRLN